jgi:hypothetical protein
MVEVAASRGDARADASVSDAMVPVNLSFESHLFPIRNDGTCLVFRGCAKAD